MMSHIKGRSKGSRILEVVITHVDASQMPQTSFTIMSNQTTSLSQQFSNSLAVLVAYYADRPAVHEATSALQDIAHGWANTGENLSPDDLRTFVRNVGVILELVLSVYDVDQGIFDEMSAVSPFLG